MSAPRTFDITIAAVMVMSVMVSMSLIVVSLNRGFEFTDESYYLIAAMYPESLALWLGAMHWFTPVLWGLSGTAVSFRLAGLTLLSLGALTLSFGFVKYVEAENQTRLPIPRRVIVYATGLGGALLYGSFVQFDPSYNLLACSSAYAAIGALLLSFVKSTRLGRSALRLAAGMLLGVAFLCKFPAGAAVLAISSLFILMLMRNLRRALAATLLLLAGMIVTVAVVVSANSDFSTALQQWKLGMHVSTGYTSSFTWRVLGYLLNLYELVTDSFVNFHASILLIGMFVIWRKPIYFYLGIVVFSYQLVLGGYLFGGDLSGTQTTGLLAAMILSLLAVGSTWVKNWRRCALVATFFAFPFGVAFGTANPIQLNLLLSLAPWGLLISYLAFSPSNSGTQEKGTLILASLFTIVSACQVATSLLTYPYHLNGSMLRQTEPTKIGDIGVLKLDVETHMAINGFTQLAAACDIRPGTPFIGLYDIPGVAVALRVVPVATQWLFDRPFAERVLDHVSPEIVRSSIVAINGQTRGRKDHIGVPRQLVDFPEKYTLCGMVTIPYQKQDIYVWVPNSGS